MGHFLMAVLAFALVTSVGTGVVLHSTGIFPQANAGVQCGDDHKDTVKHDGAHEVNESREDNETDDRTVTPGPDHSETRDREANETGEKNDIDDKEVCEPNETVGPQESMERDVNETEDEASS
jgi:hypothetical protein